MKTIAICNRKGGVGKTTFCVNIAACMDRVFNKRVLIIDCDTQGNATSYLAGDTEQEFKSNLYTYFKNPEKTIARLDRNGLINQLKVTMGDKRKIVYNTNVFYIAASSELDYITIKRPDTLKKLLQTVDQYFDYCLLDCPPGINDASINGLASSDCIVIPVIPGKDSIRGYQMVMEVVDGLKESSNVGLYVLGIILNFVEEQVSLDKYYKEDVWGEEAKSKVFKQPIHKASVIKEAREFDKPLHYYKRTSNVAKEYQELTREIMERLEEN